MSTTELKLELIEAITRTNSESLLSEIRKLVRTNVEEETTYKLNEQQKKEIQIAENQIVEGKYLTHKEAQKQTAEWLKD